MRLHRAGNVRIRRTAWVTASDMSGTGTTPVTASMTHNIDGISPFMPHVEVECYLSRPGGSGAAVAWVQLDNYQGPVTLDSAGNAPGWISGRAARTASGALLRRFVIPLHVWGTHTSGGSQTLLVKLVGAGSAADTEWAVTGIRSRLVYQE